MNSIAGLIVLFASAFAVAVFGETEDFHRRADFAAETFTRIEAKPSVRGDDQDWFFLVKELRHLSLGRFWEKPWVEVASNQSDPVPGVLEFQKLLAARGMRLLLVPVPAKAAIYPGKLVTGFKAGAAEPIAPFLERLREGGIEVLDLESAFINAAGSSPETLLYCRHDAHFSPFAAELVAELIAKTLDLPVGDENVAMVAPAPDSVTITGDQIVGSEWEGLVPEETLALRRVTNQDGGSIEPDPGSSVLLLGDSHTLVFQAGEENGMHCRNGGVFDHLAVKLGFAPDLVGVRGSGLVQARKQLFYKASAAPGYWTGKKVVIWLFSAREFTQSADRPVTIPLDKAPAVRGEEN
jgi:alginate O-acetyltransferase complex protein AlgJ